MDASATGTRRPPRQRRLASLTLLTAVALAAAAIPFRTTWWGGWILAIAEAGIVGGLADWFAVTALFRHPLGVPVPHTAIIPANWELLAERVGTMVGDRVLTKEYVIDEISRFDLADLIARAASHVKPDDLESAVRAVARWGKHVVSFEGWLDFLFRKARRHSGQEIVLTERERRAPLIFLWPGVWRYLRHKDQ